jgi:peptide/nickel transport system permease protein
LVATFADHLTRWPAFVGRRLLSAVAALLGVTLIVFVLTHEIADPVYLILGQRATAQQYAQLRHTLGYDQPIWTQYFHYLGQLVRGNLGVSNYTLEPVSTDLEHRFPATFELAAAAMILGLIWTIPLGVWSALRPGSAVDRFSQGLVEFGVAVPSFFLGLIFVYLFYYLAHVAPSPVGELNISTLPPPRVTGFTVVDAALAGQWATVSSALGHLLLPALTLSITACPPMLQLTRNTMIGVLRSDFVKTARSLGVPEHTVSWRYAFRNALLPITTMTAMTFGFLLGGTVLVETVFSWPGIGLYAVQSMQRSDYQPVLGVTLLAAAVYILVYLIADILAILLDPRVREAT